jgi:hypothetical protein
MEEEPPRKTGRGQGWLSSGFVHHVGRTKEIIEALPVGEKSITLPVPCAGDTN